MKKIITFICLGLVSIIVGLSYFSINQINLGVTGFDVGKFGDSFGIYNALIGTFTLIFLAVTFLDQNKKLEEQSKEIKNQNFRNTLQSMLSGLREALACTSVIAQNPQGHRLSLSGKEAFLALDTGSVIYQGSIAGVEKANWIKKGGKENIDNIIYIIKQIEEYIDKSKASTERKAFYFSLLKSYLGLSERRIIGEVVGDSNITLKILN